MHRRTWILAAVLLIGCGLAYAQTTGPATTQAAAATQPVTDKGPWIIEHLKAGGLTTVVQLIVSVIGLGVAIERLVHLRRNAILPRHLATQAVDLARAGKSAELLEMASRSDSVLGLTLEAALKHRGGGLAAMSAAAGDVASRELRRQSLKCYPIAVVATIEPLLGLFGTVVGMIEAFDVVALAGSMGNPSILADSIAKALITTEVGLAIAMPALILYHYLKGRIGIMGTEVEEITTDVLNELSLKSEGANATPR